MRKISVLTAISLLMCIGCSSTPPATQATVDHAGEEQVLARIDGINSRPGWLQESTPFRIENGFVVSTGQTVIPMDHRVEAAYRISANNAKAALSSAIEQRLEFLFQNAEEGTALDATQARYIGSEASKMVTSSLRLDHNYWEKVAVIDQSGQRTVQYRVFSTVKMPESDFKAAVIEAVKKQQGKGGLSKDFSDKVDQQWDSFMNSSTQPKPASVQSNSEAKSNQGNE